MTSSSPHLLRTALGALTLVLALTALLVAATPAAAAKSCGEKVIDDWYADGRVDGTYAPHCYDDAIEALPRDVRDYSSAKDDISRALQARLRNEPAPPATTDPTPGDGDGPSEDGTPPPTDTTTGPTDTTAAPDDEGDDEEDNEAAPPVDGESASSVPIPLLILAGLALLLVAGGSAGYLIRRYQARQVTPPAL